MSLYSFIDHQHHHNNLRNRENDTMTLPVDPTRTVLQLILNQLASTTGSSNADSGSNDSDDGHTAVAPPPLTLHENAILQCPSLSLQADLDRTMVGSTTLQHHHQHQHDMNHSTDRAQAKDHAIQLLSRTMTGMYPKHNDGDDADANRSIGADIGRRMEQNIFASFALLVDRRLHAYTNVLTRHANVLASIHDAAVKEEEEEEDVVNSKMLVLHEKKLMIQIKGAQTEAHGLTSHFQLRPSGVKHHHVDHTAASSSSSFVVSAPIRYSVTMDLYIPEECDDHGTIKIVPVSFSTDGFIKCSFANDDFMIQSVKINLNTKDLLEAMVQETTRAVSIMVEVANRLFQQSHKKRSLLPRSVSYLAMPPPPPIMMKIVPSTQDATSCRSHYRRLIVDGTTMTDTTGLDLLCSAAVTDSVAVVSPHLSNVPSPKHAITVDLTLDEEQQHTTNSGAATASADDDDVSRLSLDQCADIVDVCLFGERFHTNHYDFDSVSSTPSKRIKIEL